VLLALTGDAEFIRSIRGKANDLGMHLNEFGLWRWQANGKPNGEGDVSRGFWELVRAESEKEILEELGMAYVEPRNRNFSYVSGRQAEVKRARKPKGKGRGGY
jgi:DNA polymerase beta